MTQNKKFKKAVRARMAETGENYTAARRALMRGAVERQKGRGDPLGIIDDPEAWSAAGGDEEERRAVQADMQRYERVKKLCREIHLRNMFRSVVATDDPGYHELVALGPEALPQLLRRLEEFEDNDGLAIWEPIAALYALTKASPVSDEHKGRLMAIIEDWLEWGRKEGHEWRR